ncbi:MAG: hypothetical protein LUC45_09830 [Paraprevotella sp.]|nr:hypothetical protein [Paraprevotella sp.]
MTAFLKTRPFRPVLYPIVGTLLLLSSCSDKEEQGITSTVDNKEWDLDANMDTTYRPGDDFYMYCNGSYWKKTSVGDGISDGFVGLIPDSKEVIARQVASLKDYRVNKLKSDFQNFGSNYTVADSLIRARLKKLDRENAPTVEDLWRLLADAMQNGDRELLAIVNDGRDGNVCGWVTLAPDLLYLGIQPVDSVGSVPLLERAGMNADTAR